MSNPVLSRDRFAQFRESSPTSVASSAMTVRGTLNKAILLVAITVIAAVTVYVLPFPPLAVGGLLGGLVVAIILAFKQSWAPFLAPIYALCEGSVLGVMTRFVGECADGAVTGALFCTVATLGVMLVVYRFNIINVNGRFKSILSFCLLGLLCYYSVTLILRLLGVPLFALDYGPISLLVNVFSCAVAAFLLLVDFDTIREGVAMELPKYMEWYCAYGLLVTLVWLYLELLRLLSRLNSR